MFVPPVVSVAGGPLAALTIGTLNGGTQLAGRRIRPETHVVYAPASNAALAPIGLVEPPKEFGFDLRYVMGTAGQPFVEREGPGFGSAAMRRSGRPAAPPPCFLLPVPARRGRPDAVPPCRRREILLRSRACRSSNRRTDCCRQFNLDRGEMVWQVPHGETPDNVRNHPALKGMTIPRTGQNGPVGLVITKTLVIMGDPQVTTTAEHPRGAMLRAYDKATGKEVARCGCPHRRVDRR